LRGERERERREIESPKKQCEREEGEEGGERARRRVFPSFFPSSRPLLLRRACSSESASKTEGRGGQQRAREAPNPETRHSTLDIRHSPAKTKPKKKPPTFQKKKLKNHHSVGRPQQAGHQGRRQRRARDPDREARRQLRDEGVRPGQGRRLQPRPRVWPRRGDELYAADLPGELRRAHLQGARLHHRRRGLARRPSAVRADQHVAVAARRGRVRDVRRVGRVPRVAVGESRFFSVFVSVESDSNSASSPPPASPSLSCARARVSSQ